MPLSERLLTLVEKFSFKKPEVESVSDFIRIKTEIARQLPGEPQIDEVEGLEDIFARVEPFSDDLAGDNQHVWSNEQRYSETMSNLGWHENVHTAFGDERERGVSKVRHLVDGSIEAPKSHFGYHGTSNDHWASIKKHGLDNFKGPQNIANARMRKTVTCSGDINYAQAFEGVHREKAIIIRFPLEEPIFMGKVKTSEIPIKPNLLQYSLDQGKTWFSFQTPLGDAQAYHETN